MRFVIFYSVAREIFFALNNKENSYFLTKKEAEHRIKEALSTIPQTRITLLKRAKNIHKDKRYYVLNRTNEYLHNNLKKLELRKSLYLDWRWDVEDLNKHKDFMKDKLIMENVYWRVKVEIKN